MLDPERGCIPRLVRIVFNQADSVTSERWTEWKCRGKTSFYKDDWQVSPHQRISSKSWVGSTWFFPKEPIEKESASISACQANLKLVQDNSKFYPKRCGEFIANLISDFLKMISSRWCQMQLWESTKLNLQKKEGFVMMVIDACLNFVAVLILP